MSANPHGITTNGGQRAQCSSLEQLLIALKEDISAGAESLVPECTTSELTLDPSAVLPLHRPTIGPYADGGTHDLPNEIKVSWTKATDPEKSHPQATVGTIMSFGDSRARSIVQRAACRGIVAAIEGVDGFRYTFHNAWGTKDEDGQRFSYVCQDGMQNKDRYANGFIRTQRLKGGKEKGARKPTYDCKGSIGVKISASRRCVVVYYRHYAIHGTVSDKDGHLLPPQRVSPDTVGRADQNNYQHGNTGGLLGKLQAEKSAYAPPPSTQAVTSMSRPEASNISRPLKRKRNSDTPKPSNNTGKNLSLADLLKQSQSTKATRAPTSVTSKTTASKHPPPVTYDLPSWVPQPQERPPPAPRNRQNHTAPSRPHGQPPQYKPPVAAYPPPYQPNQSPQYQLNYLPQPQQFQQPLARPQLQPTTQRQPAPAQQGVSGAPKQQSSPSQGMFMTLKPVAQEKPLLSAVPLRPDHIRMSYEGPPSYPPAPACAPWPGAPTAHMAPVQPQPQAARQESPDPWFPKR